MTARAASIKLLPALFKEQPNEGQRTVDAYFGRLRRNGTVAFKVVDPKLPKLSRIAHAPILFIAPLSLYGGPQDRLLVSLQGYGCEIIDTKNDLRPLVMARLGLRMFLASALAEALKRTFGEHRHGQTSTEKGSASKARRRRKTRR